jgi:cell fate (sporulation/competence/biofilm development) regulator YlbF (YheA/YmcA/DUF963 family)
MHPTFSSETIEQRTNDLCHAILAQPDFTSLHKKIESFLNDEGAKYQYQMLSDRGAFLQQKQDLGTPLTDDEVADFEAARSKFLENPVAKDFLAAQQEARRVQDAIHQQIAKTFELGRLPTIEDFNDGGCGTGCGCH